MSKDRVCVVTGANKGVGYAIVKELSKKFDGLIYLTGSLILIYLIFLGSLWRFDIFFK